MEKGKRKLGPLPLAIYRLLRGNECLSLVHLLMKKQMEVIRLQNGLNRPARQWQEAVLELCYTFCVGRVSRRHSEVCLGAYQTRQGRGIPVTCPQ
jgi:hypothetical protein